MFMLLNTQKPTRLRIEDLAEDRKEAPVARELKLEELNLVTGGRLPNSPYLCTATQGGPSEDCWKE